jgi:hypothetical protein
MADPEELDPPPDSPSPPDLPKANSHQLRWIVTGLAVAVIAAAIGIFVTRSSGTGPTSQNTGSFTQSQNQSAVGKGYLANESDGVIFIQWTQTGSELSGSAQVETLTGSPPNQTVNTKTISVVGQFSGSTITLSFDNGNEVFGTLADGSFTVNFPQQDGSLAPVTFTSATAARFNQALATLQGTTGSVNSQAAEANTVNSEEQSIGHAVAAVESDISGVQQDVGQLSSSLGSFGKDLSQAQTDLTSTSQMEQQVINEAHSGTDPDQVCSDSDRVASDLDTVASDGDSVSSDADSTETALTTVRNDISSLQQNASAMQTALAQRPSYTDGAPSQSAINGAVSAAKQAISSALGTANSDIGQVNGYETQAFQDAQAAAQAGNCAGPASPYTQPTIS